MALKPTELKEAFKTCIRAGRAPMVHGDPGIGKSQVAMQAADELFAEGYGYRIAVDGRLMERKPNGTKKEQHWNWVPAGFKRPWFIDVRAALLDAVDVRGLPVVTDGKASWAIPDFLPSDSRGGVFFLDEINRGTEMVANALFSLILDGHIGEYRLPANWVPAAAVNDKDTGARKLSTALNSRFIHVDACTDLEDVMKVANVREWHPAVAAFLRFRPTCLHDYKPTERVSPNPRAWEFVSQLASQGASDSILLALVTGAVGHGAAIEFVGFLKLYQDLPDIDSILKAPATAKLADTPQTMYAVSAALARRVTDSTFANATAYMDRLPVEFSVMFMRDTMSRQPGLQSTATFTKWALSHTDVVF